ncbi:Uncharacterised protein [Mycobacteroides abscessus subsp. abscessus]|nr:Uncharacterised protein [Mycobacteroides abscessus subsp. abscessus]
MHPAISTAVVTAHPNVIPYRMCTLLIDSIHTASSGRFLHPRSWPRRETSSPPVRRL